MTTAPDVAVVATQLAQTDRRALSQAWYSALRLADAAPVRPHAPAAAAGTPAIRRTPSGATAAASPVPSRERAAGPRGAQGRAATAALPDRRGTATEINRRVERAVATIARSPRRAPHTLAIDGRRVTLLVRSDARATRIVALCSEPLRSTVERALAHARFALVARGTTVNVR